MFFVRFPGLLPGFDFCVFFLFGIGWFVELTSLTMSFQRTFDWLNLLGFYGYIKLILQQFWICLIG